MGFESGCNAHCEHCHENTYHRAVYVNKDNRHMKCTVCGTTTPLQDENNVPHPKHYFQTM